MIWSDLYRDMERTFKPEKFVTLTQQFPKRDKLAKRIRKGLIAKAGCRLITADYSGQELRILAAYSRDPHLIQSYNPCFACQKCPDKLLRKGRCEFEDKSLDGPCTIHDVHSFVTKLMYGDELKDVPIYDVKKLHEPKRDLCKAISFLLVYGGTPYGLAQKHNLDIKVAEEMVERFFNTFPAVRDYVEKVKEYTRKYGYIVDLVGRRRDFKYCGYEVPGREDTWRSFYSNEEDRTIWYHVDKSCRSFANGELRAAVNFPIQGLAASMTKVAAIRFMEAIRKANLQNDVHIVGFIHDKNICRV